MRVYEYDEDIIFKGNYGRLKVNYEGMPESWYVEEAKKLIPKGMLVIFKENLKEKLKQVGFDDFWADDTANILIQNLPKELYINLHEWIDDEPISDIKYGGVSIKDIMEQDIKKLGYEHGFVDSAKAIIKYIKTDCEDKSTYKFYFKD